MHRVLFSSKTVMTAARLTAVAVLLTACASKPSISVVVDRASTVPSAIADSSADSSVDASGAAPIDPSTVRGPGAVEANATVSAEVDGDTIRVTLSDGSRETIRLIGIDTPETKKPGSPIGCFGPEASHFTAALIPVGTPVALELDIEQRDRYGRLLAYVRRAADGLFVNEALATYGYAMVLTYPPNVAYTDHFVDAVAQARDQGRGLWTTCSTTN
jgi:micrococcal nuclease